MSDIEPDILLLGGGYTLGRLAATLPPERTIVTSTSLDGVVTLSSRGLNGALVDYRNAESVATLFTRNPGIRTIVDSAPPPSRETPAEGIRTLIEGTKLLAVPPSIIYLSTTGVFGGEDGEAVDESSPANPRNPGAEARTRCEDAYRGSGLKTCCARIPAIYGPGRGLGMSLLAGTYRLVDDGSRWTNRIHVNDLVAALRALVELEGRPEIVCTTDDEPSRAADVVSYYCAKFGYPTPERISLAEARAGGMHHLLSNQRVSNRLMKSLLSKPLEYPSYREGAGTEFEE